MQPERTDPSATDLSGTERAIHGAVTPAALRDRLDHWARARLGSSIRTVRFRAGRIDVVWGVELEDGRAVVIRTHRPPADLDILRANAEAQRLLATAGFPCAMPLTEPEEIDGRAMTAETLLSGRAPDGRLPVNRRLLAEGLARQIDILRDQSDLATRVGPGPSWCHYQSGPWPIPHDSSVDFRVTPSGLEWLDDFGQRAADQILAHRDPADVVLGHADWYAGNVVAAGGVLTGSFDWELVADSEAVIAGFSAACFAASSTGPAGISAPADVAAFLHDYGRARAAPLTDREWWAAVAAAAWIVAFNARWNVALTDHGIAHGPTIALARERGDDYLSLAR
jgi:hypothetical protein